ncbi:MAG: Multidrug resistance protein MdtE [Verrucomicrobia subdivision 3 bacterium]|nr:Multidrug resistance protein MdtE [Limisphaerales bacterium]MCS1414908.1 Multidrug resistance protein MdtE [Limisphaerales bacterium]
MSYRLLNRTKKRVGSVRFVILTGVLSLIAGCGPDKDSEEGLVKKKAEAKPVLVELGQVKRGMIEELLDRSSALEAEAQVQVLARTQNPAVELLVEEGDLVAKDQVLLRLESDRQETDYAQALSQLEEALIEFDRQESLYQQQLISESEYRNAKFRYNRAELTAETAKRQLEYTEVRAPIKGTITSRSVKVGDQVNLGTPIFEIIDLESTVAVVHVPEQYLPKLKAGMEARLISDTYGGKGFAGYVKRVSPVVEARAGTVKVVVGVKELGPLRPGMWVVVELVLDSNPDALLIPKRAITYDNDQTFVFKVYSDTNGVMRARRHLVVQRNVDKLNVEPMDGFELGDTIVVAGHAGLKDAAAVRVLKELDQLSLVPDGVIFPTNAVSASTQRPPPGMN